MSAKRIGSQFASIAIVLAVCAGIAAIVSFSNIASAEQIYTLPTCSIYATASTGPGQAVTLSWNSSNATQAFLSPGGGVATNGSQVVYPTTTTTYTLAVHRA